MSSDESAFPICHITVDTRLESYASFFDHQWSRDFGAVTDRSRLASAGFDLCRDWKGTALVSRMPWLMVESLQSFHLGFTRTHEPFWRKLTRAFGEWLVKDARLSNMRKKELKSKVTELGIAAERQMKENGPAFDGEAIWKEYLAISEFTLALWNSQRICYGAVYYAYESFVQRCVAVGKAEPDYRAFKAKELRNDFGGCFGKEMADQCVGDPVINLARLVRNTLVHNGGRMSPELEALDHDFQVLDGQLQIMAQDVRALFDLLKAKALLIAGRAEHLAAFK